MYTKYPSVLLISAIVAACSPITSSLPNCDQMKNCKYEQYFQGGFEQVKSNFRALDSNERAKMFVFGMDQRHPPSTYLISEVVQSDSETIKAILLLVSESGQRASREAVIEVCEHLQNKPGVEHSVLQKCEDQEKLGL